MKCKNCGKDISPMHKYCGMCAWKVFSKNVDNELKGGGSDNASK